MSNPIAPSLLSKMSDHELKTLIQSATHILTERHSDPTNLPNDNTTVETADNLFAFLKKKHITEGDLAKKWGVSYQVWWRLREKIKKLSVERLYLLAKLANVSPDKLLSLVLNCYPQQDGVYTFEKYCPQAQQDLIDTTVQKK